MAPVTQVLKDAGLKKEDVDQIILVGGSVRIACSLVVEFQNSPFVLAKDSFSRCIDAYFKSSINVGRLLQWQETQQKHQSR